MENKQTAVEWFAQEAILLHFNHATKTLPIKVFEVAYMQLINKAKQMEKEHIMMAYNDGRINQGLKQNKNAGQYYNETYGK